MNRDHADFDPKMCEHTIQKLMFQFGKFCTMRGLAPPTKEEYREMLTQEGFSPDEIERALKAL